MVICFYVLCDRGAQHSTKPAASSVVEGVSAQCADESREVRRAVIGLLLL